jgi:pseudouridine-5'-phosphate glycosidase
MRAESPAELAAIMRTKWELGLHGGLEIANPIPEADEIPAAEIDEIIGQALRDMDAKGVRGKEATPYLLGRIVEITAGESLRANIALVKNNARLGAAIAKEYAAAAGAAMSD